MFLVIEPMTHFYVFTDEDPRNDGYDGPVEQDVRLDESGTIGGRSANATAAVPCLGQDPSDPRHFKVFECTKDCRRDGFSPVASVYGKYQSWREFQS